MKVEDLIIGNYITIHDCLQVIVELPLPENCTEENTKPILITVEFFKKITNGDNYISIGGNDIRLRKDGYIVINGMLESIKIEHCRYVHQLQNLYHALTGKELIINHKYI